MDSMASTEGVHPLQAIQSTLGSAGADPRPLQRSSLFQSANEGPAEIISKVSGVTSGGKRTDDGPYFTNNEGIPFPDPAHSKTVGGIPVASDTFLFQKQQHFNRSKNLERMVHPCGSGAFGYFETTADVSDLTKVCLHSIEEDKHTLTLHRPISSPARVSKLPYLFAFLP
jgi:catalase